MRKLLDLYEQSVKSFFIAKCKVDMQNSGIIMKIL